MSNWKKLNELEKEIWVEFHSFAYADDLKLCKGIIGMHPRWSIISGYYAMHDISKLFLGKNFGIKISGENVHKQVIDCLKEFIRKGERKNEILNLLVSAEKEAVNELNVEDLPYLLRIGKKERSKVQYYSPNVFTNNELYVSKAEKFYAEIVIPFVKIMDGLINVS